MALEFRTRDENYKGHGILPSGATILRARIFVDHLPPEFLTKPYNPYLVKDRYSHRLRYIIDANIGVDKDMFLLLGITPNGSDSTDPEAMQVVVNSSIERDGLDIILLHRDCEYQGTLHPILELTAEAHLPHLARHRHRHP
jgi:hypothetical protein